MKTKVIVGLYGALFSGLALADCPDNLGAEKMVECITIEGSGANYQDWEKSFAKNIETESPKNLITDAEIQTIQPAAGGSLK